jgi:hypothetical protein
MTEIVKKDSMPKLPDSVKGAKKLIAMPHVGLVEMQQAF